jgi:CheY-like chemotaxis protein
VVVNDSALEGLKILVVDDNDDTCELITFALELQAVEVTAVNSVNKALAVFADIKPDILISDIAMPEEDGYSLIHKIRKMGVEQGGKVPAIALTAYAEKTARQQVLEAGFQKHIPKPVELDKLIAAIMELIVEQTGTSTACYQY